MNKTFRRITAAGLAAITMLSASVTAFADAISDATLTSKNCYNVTYAGNGVGSAWDLEYTSGEYPIITSNFLSTSQFINIKKAVYSYDVFAIMKDDGTAASTLASRINKLSATANGKNLNIAVDAYNKSGRDSVTKTRTNQTYYLFRQKPIYYGNPVVSSSYDLTKGELYVTTALEGWYQKAKVSYSAPLKKLGQKVDYKCTVDSYGAKTLKTVITDTYSLPVTSATSVSESFTLGNITISTSNDKYSFNARKTVSYKTKNIAIPRGYEFYTLNYKCVTGGTINGCADYADYQAGKYVYFRKENGYLRLIVGPGYKMPASEKATLSELAWFLGTNEVKAYSSFSIKFLSTGKFYTGSQYAVLQSMYA